MHPLDDSATRLTPYLKESAIATEQKIANLHVQIGVIGCAVSIPLVVFEMLPLIMPAWLYLGILFSFLLYAIIYSWWAPYRRYLLALSAGMITLLDLLIATVIILNTGGLGSPFWGLWAAAALSYVIRFHYGWKEITATLVLFLVTVLFVESAAPPIIIPASSTIVGLGFSLLGILGIGRILVNSERKAIRKGLAAEDETIHRIVNTVQHEVNNPLTIATGNLELLRLQESGESIAGLDKIEEALKRIGKAVSQLRELEFDRSISGEGLLERFPLQEEQVKLKLDEAD